MISKLLIFRFRQFFRFLREIGVGYLIVVGILMFGAFMGFVEQLVKDQSPSLGLLGVLLATFIHLNRKDGAFLAKLQVASFKLFTAEYLIGFLPLTLVFLFSGNFSAVIVQNVGLVFLSFLKPISSTKGGYFNRLSFSFLGEKSFEAKSYFRQYFLPMTIVYFLLLFTGKFVAPGLLAALLISITFAAFFDEVESKELFEVFHFKKGILTRKIQIYLGLYFSMMVPHILLFLILHFQYWYLLLAALFLGTTLILFNIFYKYAQFTPYRRRVYNSTANSLFIFSMLIPFFYPVTLIYLLIYWLKARKNIKFYYAENQ